MRGRKKIDPAQPNLKMQFEIAAKDNLIKSLTLEIKKLEEDILKSNVASQNLLKAEHAPLLEELKRKDTLIEELKLQVKKLESDALLLNDKNHNSQEAQLAGLLEELKKKDTLIEDLELQVKELEADVIKCNDKIKRSYEAQLTDVLDESKRKDTLIEELERQVKELEADVIKCNDKIKRSYEAQLTDVLDESKRKDTLIEELERQVKELEAEVLKSNIVIKNLDIETSQLLAMEDVTTEEKYKEYKELHQGINDLKKGMGKLEKTILNEFRKNRKRKFVEDDDPNSEYKKAAAGAIVNDAEVNGDDSNKNLDEEVTEEEEEEEEKEEEEEDEDEDEEEGEREGEDYEDEEKEQQKGKKKDSVTMQCIYLYKEETEAVTKLVDGYPTLIEKKIRDNYLNEVKLTSTALAVKLIEDIFQNFFLTSIVSWTNFPDESYHAIIAFVRLYEKTWKLEEVSEKILKDAIYRRIWRLKDKEMKKTRKTRNLKKKLKNVKR